PVFTGDDTGSVVEAGGTANANAGTPTASGTLVATDPDAGESGFQADTLSGTYGSLVIDGSGNWTYTLDNNDTDTEALKASDNPTDTITVTSTDGTTHDIVIDITGADDEPVFTGDDTGSVVEAGGTANANAGTPTASGTLVATDPDAGESGFQADTLSGTYGSLVIDGSGNWTYTLDNNDTDTEALKASDNPTDTITVTSTDGTTHDIVIDITGADDEPVFTGDDTGSVVEAGGTANANAGTPTASGTLVATDPDAGESGFQADTLSGTYGSLVIDGSGNWTYTLDNNDTDTEALKASDNPTDTITVTSTDGTTHDIVIDITGADDEPVFTGDDT